MKQLASIACVWLCCAIAWGVLAGTIVSRTGETSVVLTEEVYALWGRPMQQYPPSAAHRTTRTVLVQTQTGKDESGIPIMAKVEQDQIVEDPIPLASSDVDIWLSLEQRRKGLLWFPTYDVDLRARYAWTNDAPSTRMFDMSFPLQEYDAVYDGFIVERADGARVDTTVDDGMATWTDTFAPGERREYVVSFHSRGTGSWGYQLTIGTDQVRDFELEMHTDFADVDFPAGTLSPSTHETSGGAWKGVWDFETLVASASIGVELPRRLNPGQLASRMTMFAPIGLLFFFFVVALLTHARGHDIHPLNYMFFGCAFFAFHLLFAYLVDHLAIMPSFILASAVSIGLVVSYARLFVGWTFALRGLGFPQLVYLVLFSYTFFWSGFTGLAITIGAIGTLFVLMQSTGRVDWAQRLAASARVVNAPAADVQEPKQEP
jgi:hypothetical protein